MRTDANRSIVHMDLDAFFVSVECLQNPSLIGKPVVVGGTSDRGVVSSCSYEARRYGVHSAMPTKMAKRLCPDAIFVRGDMESYSRYSRTVTEIISERVPLYEKSSIDEFYIDLSGMDRFFGCYKLASELRQTIQHETGLPISFGLSLNKTVSKVATNEAKPNGQLRINYGNEKSFLSPLSIRKLPMVGEKTHFMLRNMGIRTIATVQKMPMPLMEQLLGKHGKMIWKKANGIDNSPVVPYHERKSISTERTFGKDTIDVHQLQRILVSMTEKLAGQLRQESKLTACVAVKVRYSNFDTHTLQKRIAYTACDHTLISCVKELFERLYQKRMLVRLVGVRMSHMVRGGYQINLFEDTEELINLYQAMDRINTRYGNRAVQRASGLGITHKNINPFSGAA